MEVDVDKLALEARSLYIRDEVGIGKLLLAIRDALDYGEFGRLIDERLPFSRKTAYRLIKQYELYDAEIDF